MHLSALCCFQTGFTWRRWKEKALGVCVCVDLRVLLSSSEGEKCVWSCVGCFIALPSWRWLCTPHLVWGIWRRNSRQGDTGGRGGVFVPAPTAVDVWFDFHSLLFAYILFALLWSGHQTHLHTHTAVASMINSETMTTPLVMVLVFLHILSLPLLLGKHKEEVTKTNRWHRFVIPDSLHRHTRLRSPTFLNLRVTSWALSHSKGNWFPAFLLK